MRKSILSPRLILPADSSCQAWKEMEGRNGYFRFPSISGMRKSSGTVRATVAVEESMARHHGGAGWYDGAVH